MIPFDAGVRKERETEGVNVMLSSSWRYPLDILGLACLGGEPWGYASDLAGILRYCWQSDQSNRPEPIRLP